MASNKDHMHSLKMQNDDSAVRNEIRQAYRALYAELCSANTQRLNDSAALASELKNDILKSERETFSMTEFEANARFLRRAWLQ